MSEYFAVADVKNGFDLLPSGQLNVVVGDRVNIECKANKFVFTEPDLFHVDGMTETLLASRQGLEITRDT